jgi:hypothetical protein
MMHYLTNFSNMLWPNLATLDLIAIAIILLVLCIYLVSFTSEARLKKTLQQESDESLFAPQYKCVVFSAGEHSCKSALAYQTKPILLSGAPKLPLKGCNAEKCTCSLLQSNDRRTGNDRRDLEALDKNRKSAYANKRLLKDRRRDSINEFLLPKYRTLT